MEKHKKKIIISALVIFGVIILYLVVIPIVIIHYGQHKIYTSAQDIENYKTAIVFGAGLKENRQPNNMLRDRLDSVADLYYEEKIEKILLSGDNSSIYHNEPQAMYDYLLYEHDIRPEDLVRDYAGLRTYDTCARAKNIWGIDKALLISQGYHLSRAIFTCENMGIESTGYSATKYRYAGSDYYKTREVLAIHRAFLDVYIIHPDYIKGTVELDFVE